MLELVELCLNQCLTELSNPSLEKQFSESYDTLLYRSSIVFYILPPLFHLSDFLVTNGHLSSTVKYFCGYPTRSAVYPDRSLNINVIIIFIDDQYSYGLE